VSTVATVGRGLDELVDAIAAHRRHLAASGELAERRELRVRDELRAIVLEWVAKQADVICSGARFDTVAARVADGVIDPYTAATELVADQAQRKG
jgi:LAO/AO transport system kinase